MKYLGPTWVAFRMWISLLLVMSQLSDLLLSIYLLSIKESPPSACHSSLRQARVRWDATPL